MEKEKGLSIKYLKSLGFGDPQKSTFPGIHMKYMAMDCVLMFFNEGEGNENSFMIGYGEMRMGKHQVVTIRWTKSSIDLHKTFECLRGYSIKEAKRRREN